MKDAITLIFELLVAIAKLLGPGGGRAIIAENLLLKQQLHTPPQKSPTHQVIPKIPPQTSPALCHINCRIPR
jgi:hypothetical protein